MSKKKKIRRRLTPEELRVSQEQKLRASKIPSKKRYKRKTKHPKSGGF